MSPDAAVMGWFLVTLKALGFSSGMEVTLHIHPSPPSPACAPLGGLGFPVGQTSASDAGFKENSVSREQRGEEEIRHCLSVAR